ncbi:beta-hydroxyacyl-ACP dehydratase [Methylotenera sp. 73s]|uniref:beta-hydroxyacyl-ACP dehydratase n=2 Tax=Methylotenera TaxID=359407 RepID=UPI00035EE9FE|nr:beta-hydroxyacyl-ACP dehydratase [Methylotenera sp. 73s]
MKKQTPLKIPVNHPAFAGHFPGTPIVPGVVLLDEVLYAISLDTGLDEIAWQISSVKFLSPLKPGESVIIEHEQLANGTIKFLVFKLPDLKTETPEENRQIVMGSLVVNQIASPNQNDKLT